MKRLNSGALAAAVLLSLVPVTAHAAEKTSSDVTDGQALEYAIGAVLTDNVTSSVKEAKNGVTSSDVQWLYSKKDTESSKAMMSSLRNDAAKGYPVGTTGEIIAGVIASGTILFIGAAIAHAINTGILNLPGL